MELQIGMQTSEQCESRPAVTDPHFANQGELLWKAEHTQYIVEIPSYEYMLIIEVPVSSLGFYYVYMRNAQ